MTDEIAPRDDLVQMDLTYECTTSDGKKELRMLHFFVKNEQREQYNAVLHPGLPE